MMKREREREEGILGDESVWSGVRLGQGSSLLRGDARDLHQLLCKQVGEGEVAIFGVVRTEFGKRAAESPSAEDERGGGGEEVGETRGHGG